MFCYGSFLVISKLSWLDGWRAPSLHLSTFINQSNIALFVADVNTVGSVHTSEHDIRFEDFFWNGSGDEPLTLSLKSNAHLTVNGFVGRETFIKTATVIATVYIDDSVNEWILWGCCCLINLLFLVL